MKTFPKQKSSQAAYEFAKSFTPMNELDKDEERPSLIEGSPHPFIPKDGPSRVIGEIDYQKWQDFESKIDSEELKDKTSNTTESNKNNNFYTGCSHDHSKERQMFERPIGEQLKASQRLNGEGNQAFKEKNYGLAAVFYRKALIQSDYCFPEEECDKQIYDETKLSSLLNLSACKLKNGMHEEVLDLCNQALEIDNKNSKAYYRIGIAFISQDKYQEARQNLLKALEFQPKNNQIIAKLKELAHLEEIYIKKKAKMCNKMITQI